MKLRPYQNQAVESILAAWETDRSTLLVLPTGTGKTVTFSEVIRRRRPLGKTLVLAHRMELLDQAHGTLGALGLSAEVEQGGRRVSPYATLLGGPDVVVASVPTMRGKRLEAWLPTTFATIVIDEAHHAAARTYRDILDHFPEAKVLGVTATPDRSDGIGLGGVFDSLAFQLSIRDAVDDGWLCNIVQKSIICADLDLSRVSSRAGDLADGEVEQAMTVDSVLHQVAAPMVEEMGDRQTIVFVAGVKQAHALASVVAGYIDASRVNVIVGETPADERAMILRDYRSGKIQVLVNCAVLTEGFDAPATACIAMARPTKSRPLYTQCVGRGLRLLEGKPDCIILDFVGNSGRHKLVAPVDVLAGEDLPSDVKKEAVEIQEHEGCSLSEALAEAEERAKRRAEQEEKERRRARARAEVTYTAQLVDPFGLVGHVTPSATEASEAQRGLIESLATNLEHNSDTFGRLDRSKPMSSREASALIGKLKEINGSDGPSIKMRRTLARAGLRTDVSYKEAREIMGELANSGWRVSKGLRARWGAHEAAAAE